MNRGVVKRYPEFCETVCIHCQGIGYVKYNTNYCKCTTCKGDIFISKHLVAKLLGSTTPPK